LGAATALSLVASLAALFGHATRFCELPLRDKLSFVPDDAFYYMKLGSEFAGTRRWSFDGGRTTTTGFHLFFGYESALVEALVGSRTPRAIDLRLVLHAILGAASTAAAIVVLARLGRRVFPRGAPAAILAVACGGGAFLLPLQAMEWPYAVLAGALAVNAVGGRRVGWMVAAMVFGCACRADFAIFGACLALALWSVDWPLRGGWTRPRVFACLAGTALGVAVTSAHDWAVDGHLVQSSARMKAYWGSVSGYDLAYGLEPVSYAFSPAFLFTHVLDWGPRTLFALALGAAACAWVLRGRLRATTPEAQVLSRFAPLAIAAYAIAYGWLGAAAMCWYSASFFAAAFTGVATLADAAPEGPRRAAVAVASVLAVLAAWNARLPTWNAGGFLAATDALRADASIRVAASWNAGTLGFLGGDKVVNVDGLVNDDVYPYVVRGRLHCYLVHERIPFVVDRVDWPSPSRGAKLGYDARLLAAMSPYDLGPGGLGAWRVDLTGLARDPACAEDLRSAAARVARPYP